MGTKKLHVSFVSSRAKAESRAQEAKFRQLFAQLDETTLRVGADFGKGADEQVYVTVSNNAPVKTDAPYKTAIGVYRQIGKSMMVRRYVEMKAEAQRYRMKEPWDEELAEREGAIAVEEIKREFARRKKLRGRTKVMAYVDDQQMFIDVSRWHDIVWSREV